MANIKRHKDFTLSDKTLIINLAEYFGKERRLFRRKIRNNKINLSELPQNVLSVNKRVSEALKIGTRSVYRIRQELKSNQVVTESKKVLSGRKSYEVDSFLEGVLRRSIAGFYSESTHPTLDKVHVYIQEDPSIPKMSKETLRKIMVKKLKFKFCKFHNKPVPLERLDIVAQRHEFLFILEQLRNLGYKIFYQDETWCNENQSMNAGWHIPGDCILSTSNGRTGIDVWLRGVGQRFTDNLIGGLSGRPSGAGRRVIINHIGSEDGFLVECEDIFIGKKDSADYHSNMNCDHFENWFKKVIAAVPSKSAIVVDRAKYHRRVTEETLNPTTKWKKQDIIDWLLKRNLKVPSPFSNFSQMTRPLLLVEAKKHPLKPKFVIEEMVEKSGKDIKIVWTPIAHCELNAIELVWASVKREVGKRNKTFKLKDVCELSKKVISEITPELWKKCINHVNDLEKKLRDKEGISINPSSDKEPIIIPLCDEDESDGDVSDEECEDEDCDTDNINRIANNSAGRSEELANPENFNPIAPQSLNTQDADDIDLSPMTIFCRCKSVKARCASMKCICRQYKLKCGLQCHPTIVCNNA